MPSTLNRTEGKERVNETLCVSELITFIVIFLLLMMCSKENAAYRVGKTRSNIEFTILLNYVHYGQKKDNKNCLLRFLKCVFLHDASGAIPFSEQILTWDVAAPLT